MWYVSYVLVAHDLSCATRLYNRAIIISFYFVLD